MSDSKLDNRTVLTTFDDVTLFRFHSSVSQHDITSALPRLRLMTLPLGFTRLHSEDAFSLLEYGPPWNIYLYGAAIGDTICAVFPYRKDTNKLCHIWVIEPALFNGPAEAKIHAAFALLAAKKRASIPYRPTGFCHPFLSAPDGKLLEPTFANLPAAFFGVLALDAATTDADLRTARKKDNLTADVSNLPQQALDTFVTVNGSLSSTARLVLLRNLEIVEHLICPNAELIIAPRLSSIAGSLIAPSATYLDMRALEEILGDLKLESLAFADFDNLGLCAGNISTPAAKGIGFPTLTRFTGKLTCPSPHSVNMPVLGNANRLPVGYVPPEPGENDFIDALLGRLASDPQPADAA